MALAVAVALFVVVVSRGSFRQLAKLRIESPWLAFAALGMQAALELWKLPSARVDDLGFAIEMASYVLLVAFCVANLRMTGMSIVLVGIGMNAVVIGLNGGMPTRVPAGQHLEATPKHRPERAGDVLTILDDRILLRLLGETISFGDIVLAAGLANICYRASRRSRAERSRAAHNQASTGLAPQPRLTLVTEGSTGDVDQDVWRERVETATWLVSPASRPIEQAPVPIEFTVEVTEPRFGVHPAAKAARVRGARQSWVARLTARRVRRAPATQAALAPAPPEPVTRAELEWESTALGVAAGSGRPQESTLARLLRESTSEASIPTSDPAALTAAGGAGEATADILPIALPSAPSPKPKRRRRRATPSEVPMTSETTAEPATSEPGEPAFPEAAEHAVPEAAEYIALPDATIDELTDPGDGSDFEFGPEPVVGENLETVFWTDRVERPRRSRPRRPKGDEEPEDTIHIDLTAYDLPPDKTGSLRRAFESGDDA